MPTNIPIIFLYKIFSRSSFILSSDSFVLEALARNTDWNLFPLCITTSLKVTSKEYITKRHSFELCWFPRVCVTDQHHYKITDRFLDRKITGIHFGHCETKNTFQYLGGEDLKRLFWNLRFQLAFRQIQIMDKVVKISLC